MGKPGGLQSMGSQRVGHNWAAEHLQNLSSQEHLDTYFGPSLNIEKQSPNLAFPYVLQIESLTAFDLDHFFQSFFF